MADPTGTVTSEFLTEVSTTDPAGEQNPTTAGPGPTGTAVTSLDELNALFTSWVEVVYHQRMHTSTGQTPLARWAAGWEGRRPVHKDPAMIAEAFCWSAHRTVSKTGTVSLHGNTYQVDPLLAGARVELVYDPFDLTTPIAVTVAGGVPAGQAVLLEISRHVHPKAAKAIVDADPASATLTTGIDYLRLVEHTHQESMTAQRITYTAITDHAQEAPR